MTDKQPEALRIADALDELDLQFYSTELLCDAAAAELRRLHEVNAELVEALWAMLSEFPETEMHDNPAIVKAHDAIYKATGEQQ